MAYGAAIADGGVPLDTYLDLALIYMNFYDPGFTAFHHIALEVIEDSSDRLDKILTEAEERFGRIPEIDFWRRYAKFFGLGEPPFYDDAKALADEGASVAYLHLAGQGPYQTQAQALLKSVAVGRTCRERFIRSVLQSSVLRDWWLADA